MLLVTYKVQRKLLYKNKSDWILGLILVYVNSFNYRLVFWNSPIGVKFILLVTA